MGAATVAVAALSRAHPQQLTRNPNLHTSIPDRHLMLPTERQRRTLHHPSSHPLVNPKSHLITKISAIRGSDYSQPTATSPNNQPVIAKIPHKIPLIPVQTTTTSPSPPPHQLKPQRNRHQRHQHIAPDLPKKRIGHHHRLQQPHTKAPRPVQQLQQQGEPDQKAAAKITTQATNDSNSCSSPHCPNKATKLSPPPPTYPIRRYSTRRHPTEHVRKTPRSRQHRHPTNNHNDTAPRSIPTLATRKDGFQTCPYKINNHPGSTNTPTPAQHQTTTNNPTHPLIPKTCPGLEPGSQFRQPPPTNQHTHLRRKPNNHHPNILSILSIHVKTLRTPRSNNIRANMKDEFKFIAAPTGADNPPPGGQRPSG